MLRVIFFLVLIQWGFAVSYGKKRFYRGIKVGPEPKTCIGIVPNKHRENILSIRYFGAIGDEKTLNTKDFRTTISQIQNLNNRDKGSTLLYISSGVWLTETFNLTSHMTLYLAKDVVLLNMMDIWCTSINHHICVGPLVLNFSMASTCDPLLLLDGAQ